MVSRVTVTTLPSPPSPTGTITIEISNKRGIPTPVAVLRSDPTTARFPRDVGVVKAQRIARNRLILILDAPTPTDEITVYSFALGQISGTVEAGPQTPRAPFPVWAARTNPIPVIMIGGTAVVLGSAIVGGIVAGGAAGLGGLLTGILGALGIGGGVSLVAGSGGE